MVNWRLLSDHLTRHGYLYDHCHLAPFAVTLLTKFADRWRQHSAQCCELPLLSAPHHTDKQHHQKALSVELFRVASLHNLCAPYGITVNTVSAASSVCPPDDLIPQSSPRVRPPSDAVLSLCVCVPVNSAQCWFRMLQRRRRIWWREMMTDPANIVLQHSSLSPSDQNKQDGAVIWFKDQLPLERIQLQYFSDISVDSNSDNTSTVSTSGQVAVLSSTVDVDCVLWSLCGDALQSNVLHLCEHLTPVSRAILATGTNHHTLYALCARISNQWIRSGLSVYPGRSTRLRVTSTSDGAVDNSDGVVDSSIHEGSPCNLSPTTDNAGDSVTNDVQHERQDKEWLKRTVDHLDGVGVPDVVIVDDETLKTGVCQIRSRDTTLCRQTHISSID